MNEMKWTCDEVTGQLEAFLDGEVRPGVRARLEAHLKGCPQCREAADAFRQVGAAVREGEADVALTLSEADAFWPAVRARIREAEATAERRSLAGLGRAVVRILRPAVLVPALEAFAGIILGVSLLRTEHLIAPAEAAEVESLEGGPSSTVMLLHEGRGKPPIIWIFQDGAGPN